MSGPDLIPKTSPPLQIVEDLTAENVRTIKHLEKAAQQDESFGDRIATEINRVCGSITFLWINAIGFIVWMSVDTVMFEKPWDPFPLFFTDPCRFAGGDLSFRFPADLRQPAGSRGGTA
jgi:hypothetical protein